MDKVDLYINEAKLNSEIKADLEKDGVVLHPYNDIYEDIKKTASDEVLLIDPARLNYALYNNIPEGVAKVEERNPEILFKAIKNEVEIEKHPQGSDQRQRRSCKIYEMAERKCRQNDNY